MSFPSNRSEDRVKVRVRADLVFVKTIHRNEATFVVKDPLAMKYHRVRPDEYFVLQRLDGTRSLETLCGEYEAAFLPQQVSKVEMNQLLFRFHQNGLTVSDSIGQGDQLDLRRAKERDQRIFQQLTSLLFIRFPGVDPEPFLRCVYPWVRPIFHPLSLVLISLFCFMTGGMFLQEMSQFGAEFPTLGTWLRLESLLLLAAVIGGTKVLHELGHAFVCKHFGGECHQIGPMLLVFSPALYCDTSDAWMLPSRWQRATIGLAGIATEVILAAIATWVWVLTAPGWVHSIAMNVMVVCGISTVVFNANPLLRYDGYYVLSDLVDVPNLGERARRMLSATTNRWFFGIHETVEPQMSTFGRVGLFVYALAAASYRWGLTLLILWVVSVMLRPYGLESIGRTFCLVAFVAMMAGLVQPLIKFFNNPARRGRIQMQRTLFSILCMTGLLLIAFLPLPSSINTTARIVPRHQTYLYVSTEGILDQLHRRPGERVKQGEVIATLVNPDIEYQYLKALGRVETQRALVDALRQSRFESTEASNELPAAEALLKDLEDQLESRKHRQDGLVVRAPVSGKLIVGARRSRPKQVARTDALQFVEWSGYPTDAQNDGSFLGAGTELMTLVESNDWDLEMVLSQSDVQRIELGAAVKLSLQSAPSTVFRASVVDISRTQWTFEANTPRWDDSDGARQTAPATTSYVVRAAVEDSGTTEHRWLAGSEATGQIEADLVSVVSRIARSLSSLLRFR
ncbi:HlyD family efflux transporter periplasmic adaptor subunit [Novipirellula artificiosorum]|uniref:HlyD family secretion protein n=1 Tax=Novipirellula artificiosorum TaxID=2528016 RepID=A0A5C6DJ79_9BACT|nr:HlyD family efflux transporter periplasmic adaptor subunit [Novipirellula artificiosorum]TWU34959.1 HlyD family secretion protein [Novipirellula artificiosorum]